MIGKTSLGMTLAICIVSLPLAAAPAAAKELKVISDKTVAGFGYPESVAYDPKGKVFYVGNFGPALKPADKDGKGTINKVSMDGKIIEEAIFPPKGQTMNKPKGIWIKGNHMWVADIDSVWQFDLKTKEAKRLELPGITYANDVTLIGKALYISDNRSDKVASVEPADFLKAKAAPKIAIVYSGKSIFPNGLYPGKNGSLIMVGFEAKDKPHAIYEMMPGKEPKQLSDNIGMLDGLYQMKNGDLIVTDWVTNSLFQWNKKMGKKDLVTGIKGPADLCVIPNKQGLLVVVPDLVKGELRFVQLGD
jgi:sugar lactone lactonase YvrE